MASQPVTVIARIKAKPGCEERVRQALRDLLAPTRREHGCLNYDMHEAAGDATSFVFYENWESEEDLRAHLRAPHLAAWFELSKTVLAEPIEISRWRRVK